MDRVCGTYGGQEKCIQGLCGKPERKKLLEDLGVEGRILLKLFLSTELEEYGLDWSGLEQRQVAGSCECGKECFSSMKCRKVLTSQGTTSAKEGLCP